MDPRVDEQRELGLVDERDAPSMALRRAASSSSTATLAPFSEMTRPPALDLGLDMNAINEEALNNSYELSDEGTLIAGGFRIGSSGGAKLLDQARSLVSRATSVIDHQPSSSKMPLNNHRTKSYNGASGAPTSSMIKGLVFLEEIGRGASGCVRKVENWCNNCFSATLC